MKYNLSKENNNILPKARYVLESLEGIDLFHKNYNLRHPLGVYNISLSEVLDKLSGLLAEMEKAIIEKNFLDPKENKWEKPLIDSLDHFLDAVMQHLDDCKSIICSFFPDCKSKAANKTLRSFNDQIRPYRDHVALIVNTIKHNQGRLRLMFFHNTEEVIFGYYIEGVIDDGIVGPNPKIHKNGNTAISLNRDLPYHLCNLYYVSAQLAQSIYEITRKSWVTCKDIKEDDKLIEILIKISNLEKAFFPDEEKKPMPFVKCISSQNQENIKLALEFPSTQAKPREMNGRYRIGVSFRGDGITKTFKMPYFQE